MPPEDPKAPTEPPKEDGPAQPEALQSVEMVIQVDLDEDAEQKRIETHRKRLGSALQGILVGIGAYSASYLGVRELDVPEGASIAMRVGAGASIGMAFGFAMDKLRSGLDEPSILKLVRQKDAIKAVRALTYAGLGGIALASLGVPLAAAWYDFEHNLAVGESVDATALTLDALQQNPRLSSAIHALEVRLHQDVIRSLGPDGEITREAAATMWLYYDGQHVAFNPEIEPGAQLQSFWTDTINGSEWAIGFFEPDNWLVRGPSNSWWVGPSTDFPTAQEVFDQTMTATQKPRVPYRDLILGSGKIDDRPVILELIDTIGKLQSPESLQDGLDELHAWAPFEWNHRLRTTIQRHIAEEEQAVLDDYSARAQAGYEALFGSSALDDPSSYASLVRALTPTPKKDP